MNKLLMAIVKLTAWPVQKLCFRTKIYYEDKKVQGRRINGPAILISNHTSVYDYGVFLFVFYSRILRYQMAEILFKKKVLGWFLRGMGGVYVNRERGKFSFVEKSQEVLREGGVLGIFPEGRLPKKNECRPLPFVPSAAYIALKSGVPVIPIYTNGSYFCWKRARVIIGTPMRMQDYYDDALTEKENLRKISNLMRDRILELKNELEKKVKHKKILAWKYFFHDFVRVTGCPAILWVRLRKIYTSELAKKKIKGGAIVISNHTGWLDPMKMMCAFWYRRVNFLAAKELFESRLGNFFFRHMLCMCVDRENFNMSVFKDVVERAREGELVCVYPEGQISRGNEEDGIGTFKAGVVLMAFKSDVPIVPVYSPKERNGFWHDMVIGEPINIRKICGPIFNMENINKANNYLREKELELIRIYNERKKEG